MTIVSFDEIGQLGNTAKVSYKIKKVYDHQFGNCIKMFLLTKMDYFVLN